MKEATVAEAVPDGISLAQAKAFLVTADLFASTVQVACGEGEFTPLRVEDTAMQLLVAEPRSALRIRADGPDEEKALRALVLVAQSWRAAQPPRRREPNIPVDFGPNDSRRSVAQFSGGYMVEYVAVPAPPSPRQAEADALGRRWADKLAAPAGPGLTLAELEILVEKTVLKPLEKVALPKDPSAPAPAVSSSIIDFACAIDEWLAALAAAPRIRGSHRVRETLLKSLLKEDLKVRLAPFKKRAPRKPRAAPAKPRARKKSAQAPRKRAKSKRR